ncbi:MAG: histidine phosphatase family protein [Clostridia bacterium]|nr:histidine phosphatase family protein [Clostridia bacterium]
MDLSKKKGLIIFVRHGQTDWNTKGLMQGREDIPLNETGLEQAALTAQGIKNACDKTGIVFDKVVSSPLLRASVTGDTIAASIGCGCVYCDDRVTERDFGDLSGTPFDTNSKYIMTDVTEQPTLEPVSSLISRVKDFIKDTASTKENILVVTHGAVTRIFADNAKKAPGYEITAPFLLNCHLVVYSYNGSEAILQGYNVPSDRLDEFLEEI